MIELQFKAVYWYWQPCFFSNPSIRTVEGLEILVKIHNLKNLMIYLYLKDHFFIFVKNLFIYDKVSVSCMIRTKLTKKEKENTKKEQKTRAEQSRAARRSGKSMKTEGKVTKSTSKTKESRSSKKIATIKKRTRS